MWSLARALELDTSAYTWKDILQLAHEELNLLSCCWTPSRNTDTDPISKKEFQNFINNTNQRINNLKIQPSAANKSSGSGGEGKQEQVCFDCGKTGVTINHPGCPNKGERLFLPDKFKKNPKFKKETSFSPKDDKHPKAEEKTENGVTYHYCQRCNRGEGMWRPVSDPKVHKTAQYRGREHYKATQPQLVAQTTPATLINQICTSSPPTLTVLTPEQELLAANFHQSTGIPLDTLRSQMVQVKVNTLQVNSSAPTALVNQMAQMPPKEVATKPHGGLQLQIPTMTEVGDDLLKTLARTSRIPPTKQWRTGLSIALSPP